MPRALVVDDDPQILEPLARLVEREGFTISACATLEKAQAELAAAPCDLVVSDLRLPDGTALDLLPKIQEQGSAGLILITGFGTVDSAVEAFRGGVLDYLTKPVDTQHLRRLLRNVLRTIDLRDEVNALRAELRRVGRFGNLIGASAPMQRVYDQILRVAPTDTTVFITGETGTGKELVAEAIHRVSPRAKGPLVPVNCGAVAANLMESELFGHERGSFTGATQQHRGVFERAHGGTLFLDEVTEMPPDLQVKLLRTLETRKLQRVGGEQEIEIDVRLVSASNVDPEKAVRDGKLREDLLYRLLVFPITVPPLRDRGDDVTLIAEYYLAQLNQEANTSKRFTPEALDQLCAQLWPGNARELRNCVERAFIMAQDRIGAEQLPFAKGAGAPTQSKLAGVWSPIGRSLAECEQDVILATLEHCAGDKGQAAKILGISVKTLYNRLHRYGAMK